LQDCCCALRLAPLQYKCRPAAGWTGVWPITATRAYACMYAC
jgi:hypothetical protein